MAYWLGNLLPCCQGSHLHEKYRNPECAFAPSARRASPHASSSRHAALQRPTTSTWHGAAQHRSPGVLGLLLPLALSSQRELVRGRTEFQSGSFCSSRRRNTRVFAKLIWKEVGKRAGPPARHGMQHGQQRTTRGIMCLSTSQRGRPAPKEAAGTNSPAWVSSGFCASKRAAPLAVPPPLPAPPAAAAGHRAVPRRRAAVNAAAAAAARFAADQAVAAAAAAAAAPSCDLLWNHRQERLRWLYCRTARLPGSVAARGRRHLPLCRPPAAAAASGAASASAAPAFGCRRSKVAALLPTRQQQQLSALPLPPTRRRCLPALCGAAAADRCSMAGLQAAPPEAELAQSWSLQAQSVAAQAAELPSSPPLQAAAARVALCQSCHLLHDQHRHCSLLLPPLRRLLPPRPLPSQ